MFEELHIEIKIKWDTALFLLEKLKHSKKSIQQSAKVLVKRKNEQNICDVQHIH